MLAFATHPLLNGEAIERIEQSDIDEVGMVCPVYYVVRLLYYAWFCTLSVLCPLCFMCPH